MPKQQQPKTNAASATPYTPNRVPEPRELPKPISAGEFKALVDKYSPRRKRGWPREHPDTSNCDWCSTVTPREELQTNEFQMSVTLRVLSTLSHNEEQLIDEMEQKLGRVPPDRTSFTDGQLQACRQFQQMRNDQSDNGWLANCSMESPQMDLSPLLSILNQIFFPGAPITFSFSWTTDPAFYGSCFTRLPRSPGNLPEEEVQLNSTLTIPHPEYPLYNQRAMGRLSTLLHELLHAHVQAYACLKCDRSRAFAKDAAGHGILWHYLASRVELATLPMLGIPLRLDRFRLIKHGWKVMKHWPSRERVRAWALQDDD